jgi:hypothetical protein
LAVIAAPAIALPVAAVPLIVRFVAELDVDDDPPPPQATRMLAITPAKKTSFSFIFFLLSYGLNMIDRDKAIHSRQILSSNNSSALTAFHLLRCLKLI